ncbi:MAG: hypothetical protein FJY35_01580 [Betaproteobacteria bacterium]|jgi:hypothetical protein|nr:hypothetical protein [Betaproteobacteria bacterium]
MAATELRLSITTRLRSILLLGSVLFLLLIGLLGYRLGLDHGRELARKELQPKTTASEPVDQASPQQKALNSQSGQPKN